MTRSFSECLCDWRQDVIFRDTWRALPLPRAHSMSLRSDRNHSSVCCADYSHPDRPDYYVSERDYFKLKRRQLRRLKGRCESPFICYALWVTWVCEKMKSRATQGGWTLSGFFGALTARLQILAHGEQTVRNESAHLMYLMSWR